MIRSFAPKDPEEVDYWNIDFSDRMPETDSIASLVAAFVEPTVGDGALTVDQTAFSGKVVSGRWQGGTPDTTYWITVRVTTTQGRTLDKSGEVFVTSL